MDREYTQEEIIIIENALENVKGVWERMRKDQQEKRRNEVYLRKPPRDLQSLYRSCANERANLCLLCKGRKVGSKECQLGEKKEVSHLITCGISSCHAFSEAENPVCFIKGTWIPVPAKLIIEYYRSKEDGLFHSFLVKRWKQIGADYINRHERE